MASVNALRAAGFRIVAAERYLCVSVREPTSAMHPPLGSQKVS